MCPTYHLLGSDDPSIMGMRQHSDKIGKRSMRAVRITLSKKPNRDKPRRVSEVQTPGEMRESDQCSMV